LVDALQGVIPSKHPVRKILDLSPYGSPNRSLSKGLCTSSLLNYPHGIDLGPLQSRLPERLYTAKKRIRLAPTPYLKDMSRLRKRVEVLSEQTSSDQLLLIGRRHVRSNNSWLHNSHRLVKGKNRCTLIIHPEDAKRAKLSTGDIARITSRVGEVEIETQVSDTIMQGVISVPHGWGHNRIGSRMQTASKKPGVSINDLSDDSFVDRLTGTSALNGIPVSVAKVVASKAKQKATSNKVKTRVRVSAKLS